MRNAGSYNSGGSKADVGVYHYPGENSLQMWDAEPRPILFGEYAHLNTDNRRELFADPGIRSKGNDGLMR